MKKIIGKYLVAAAVAVLALAGCSMDAYDVDRAGAYFDGVSGSDKMSGEWGESEFDGEGGGQANYPSGLVTAGEWNDIANWQFWANLLNNQDWTSHALYWKYYPHNFVCVETVDESRNVVCGVPVTLFKDGEPVWKAQSDNTGRALLWANLYKSDYQLGQAEYTIKVSNREYTDFEFTTPYSSEVAVNRYVVNPTSKDNAIDVAFIVDATGSMGDELEFLKADLEDIINLVGQQCTSKVRTGTVFYRDNGDKYVTKYSQLTSNLKDTMKFIGKQSAEGGGDWPEAVHMALSEGLQSLSWNSDARSRVAFLVLDAPPHHEDEIIASCQKSIEAYAAAGIKIVPVAASGIDKACEYLLRSFAMATNGTYVFITNDSGIGNEHIEATVGEYQVEKLRDLIARLIIAYAR
ncbi:MAG: VWA domain-containing protein [Bacteroidales bacterium]|nr:VWA domain-containing protein [Bacteroidales bacterium]